MKNKDKTKSIEIALKELKQAQEKLKKENEYRKKFKIYAYF